MMKVIKTDRLQYSNTTVRSFHKLAELIESCGKVADSNGQRFNCIVINVMINVEIYVRNKNKYVKLMVTNEIK